MSCPACPTVEPPVARTEAWAESEDYHCRVCGDEATLQAVCFNTLIPCCGKEECGEAALALARSIGTRAYATRK